MPANKEVVAKLKDREESMTERDWSELKHQVAFPVIHLSLV
jgi:hypothetical protein